MPMEVANTSRNKVVKLFQLLVILTIIPLYAALILCLYFAFSTRAYQLPVGSDTHIFATIFSHPTLFKQWIFSPSKSTAIDTHTFLQHSALRFSLFLAFWAFVHQLPELPKRIPLYSSIMYCLSFAFCTSAASNTKTFFTIFTPWACLCFAFSAWVTAS